MILWNYINALKKSTSYFSYVYNVLIDGNMMEDLVTPFLLDAIVRVFYDELILLQCFITTKKGMEDCYSYC